MPYVCHYMPGFSPPGNYPWARKRECIMLIDALKCSNPECSFMMCQGEVWTLASQDMVCDECGHTLQITTVEVDDEFLTCRDCEAPLERTWDCPECGQDYTACPDGFKCTDCGVTVGEMWQCPNGCDEMFNVAGEMVRKADLIRRNAAKRVPTDRERLDKAFCRLSENGIVARHDVACCWSCGFTEMRNELRKMQSEGREVRGFAFYHMYDTDHAYESGELHISYGVLEGGAEDTKAIGRAVARAIQNEGLFVDWDGPSTSHLRVHLLMTPVEGFAHKEEVKNEG